MKADRRIAGWAVRTAALGAMPRTACPPIRLSAQSRFWRPEDRALISDFSYVTAVAASPFTVFGATTHGLVVYDRQARTWRLPVTTLDGYPASRVRAALADATGNAVWLGTTSGWARYDADAQRWDSGFVAGGVSNLVLDARDAASGVYVQGAFGWSFLPRGAIVPVADRPLPPPGQRIQPLDAGTALNLAPAAQALRALILTDPRLRAHRFLSAARSPDRSDLFFGTDGMGLVRVDAATAEWENLSYGLLSARAGAVALAPGGVWVASAGRVAERHGVGWVGAGLSGGTTPGGPGGGPPRLGGRAREPVGRNRGRAPAAGPRLERRRRDSRRGRSARAARPDSRPHPHGGHPGRRHAGPVRVARSRDARVDPGARARRAGSGDGARTG